MDKLLLGAFLSGIVANSLTLNLMENAGILFRDGQVFLQDDPETLNLDPQLHGGYADAVLITSAISIGLCALYIIGLLYQIKFQNLKVKYYEGFVWMAYIIALLTVVTASALNITLIDQYANLKDLRTEPAVPIPKENYKLRGPMGTGVLAINSASLFASALGVICLVSIYIPAMRVYVK